MDKGMMKGVIGMRRICGALFCFSLSAVCALAGAEGPLVLSNQFLRVEVDRATGSFSIAGKPGGQVMIRDGQWNEARGPALLAEVDDPVFGKGQCMALTGGRILVFPNLPFALFRELLKSQGGEAVVINQRPLLSATVAMPGELKTMGTGGLQAPKDNRGSYVWLTIANPQTRGGIVGAWLTHDRGNGVVFSPVTNSCVRIAARVEYGKLRVKPGETLETETFALGCFEDVRFGLESFADAVARQYAIRLLPRKSGFCTWYTEKHARACDEKNLKVVAGCAARELKPYGFDFVQIDDGWQINGRVFEREDPKGAYPSGMKAAAGSLAQLGLTPGLWFIPFAGDSKRPEFKTHQDWFYQDKNGKPFQAAWGGTCLDMSVPQARDYLRQLILRYSNEWGYKLFKMDGLWTGTGTRLMYVNNGYQWDELGEAPPRNPDVTNIEAYRTGLKLVRETAGPDVFLLGCCVSQNMRSFGGAMGLVDAMRVGPDTGSGCIGAPHASRHYFLNGRVWWNDPDCVSVRDRTPLEQARVNASFTAITGDLFYNSDWIPDLPTARLEILKRTLLSHSLPVRPIDYLENDPARIWHVQAKDRDVVALFNWGGSELTISCGLDRIALPVADEYVAFDFWNNRFLPSFRGELKARLPGNSCRVLAIRPVAAHPQLLSTSGHILQGMLDVRGEAWDDQAMVLSGVSKVVTNDPYELRVVVPVGEHSWRALPPATQEGPNIRLAFTNAASAEVTWQLKFERGDVKPAVEGGEALPPTNAAAVTVQKQPAPPPVPEVYLDGLKPVCTSNEWRSIRVNKSVMGNHLTLEGKSYEHGLGCHANALLVYSVPAGARRFVAVVGLDDETKHDLRSSVVCEVYGDVKEMGEEPELLAKSPVLSGKTVRSWAFNAELTERHREVRLVVKDAGDGNAADHVDWVAAGFATK